MHEFTLCSVLFVTSTMGNTIICLSEIVRVNERKYPKTSKERCDQVFAGSKHHLPYIIHPQDLRNCEQVTEKENNQDTRALLCSERGHQI